MSPIHRLAPCPACNRHVSVDETACPFCAVALPESFRAQSGPAAPRSRLSRAAMFAAGATLLGTAACSESTQPVYGAPVDSAVQSDAADGAGGGQNGGDAAGGSGGGPADAADDRGPVALYGAAPPLDAAVTPAYGISPVDPNGTNGKT